MGMNDLDRKAQTELYRECILVGLWKGVPSRSYVKKVFKVRVNKNISTSILTEDKEINYSYRLTEKRFYKGQAYGIEVERQDVVDGSLVTVERDSIDLISPNKEKVEVLLNLLAKNNVSPIHLVDIIGEYVDQYVGEFDKYRQ